MNLRDRLASAEPNGKSSTVELDSSKSQLAAASGTISATLSRVFYRVTPSGMISINGSQIEVLDRDRFRSCWGIISARKARIQIVSNSGDAIESL